MKKTFNLTHPKIKYPRMVDAVKNEIRKYIKRERRKDLPENVDYWDFECKFGDAEAGAKMVHLSEIDQCINDAEQRELISFYVEILRTEGVRQNTASKRTEDRPHVIPDVPKPKSFGE